MIYRQIYKTPEGFSDMIMEGYDNYLTGLWFNYPSEDRRQDSNIEYKMLPVFKDTIRWLDIYFSGKDPGFHPLYKIDKLTGFRSQVLDMMLKIPFGATSTYGSIASAIAEKRGIRRMSAQAVGGAVGWNPICLIIPCHRVIGSDNSLTGYGGGIHNKVNLLKLEGHTVTDGKVL